MPITDKQFEQGLDNTKTKVIELLEKHSTEALSFEEIANDVGFSKDGLGRVYNEFLLESMVVEGLLEKKILKLQGYYRIPKKDS